MSYQSGTLYNFTETGSQDLIARTIDAKELLKFMNGQEYMGLGQKVLIADIEYKIVAVTIEPMKGHPQPFNSDGKYHDYGENGMWNIFIQIFIERGNK